MKKINHKYFLYCDFIKAYTREFIVRHQLVGGKQGSNHLIPVGYYHRNIFHYRGFYCI